MIYIRVNVWIYITLSMQCTLNDIMDGILWFNQSPHVFNYYIMSHNNNLGYDVKAISMEIILMHIPSILYGGCITQYYCSLPGTKCITKSIDFYCIVDKIIIQCTYIGPFVLINTLIWLSKVIAMHGVWAEL